MKFIGISHITLTVKNIYQTAKFYSQLFGINLLVKPDKSLIGVLTFNLRQIKLPISFKQHKNTSVSDTFNFQRIGLDHLAIQVESEKDLQDLYPKLIKAWEAVDNQVKDGKTKGIEICAHTGRKYICFQDPSDLPIEFYLGQ